MKRGVHSLQLRSFVHRLNTISVFVPVEFVAKETFHGFSGDLIKTKALSIKDSRMIATFHFSNISLNRDFRD